MRFKLMYFAASLVFLLGLGSLQALSPDDATPNFTPTSEAAPVDADSGVDVDSALDTERAAECSTEARSCTALACQAECPGFGGDYIAGRCYCCG